MFIAIVSGFQLNNIDKLILKDFTKSDRELLNSFLVIANPEGGFTNYRKIRQQDILVPFMYLFFFFFHFYISFIFHYVYSHF